MKEHTSVEIHPAAPGRRSPGSWVSFQYGIILSAHLGVEDKIQPLLDYLLQNERFDGTKELSDFLTVVPCYSLKQKQVYFDTIYAGSQAIFVRKPDLRINATQILAGSGLEGQLDSFKQEHEGAFDIVS